MIPRYNNEFKRDIVLKVFASPEKSVEEIAREFNVARASLFRWLKEVGSVEVGSAKRVTNPKLFTTAQKIRAILEVQSLKEREAGAYLRQHGLYWATISEWKADILDEVKKNSKSDKIPKLNSEHLKRIRDLERQLKMKTKALKEATALLALKKKVESIWGESEDEKSAESSDSNAKTSSKKRKKTGVD